MNKMIGRVKWFDDKKGYGFIGEGQLEYFVYFKDILKHGYRTLTPEETVEFIPDRNEKGLVAKEVRSV